jgi:CRP-like cAMP-binding protein
MLHIMEREIGARAGLTRETVSRELRKLKDEALISVSKQGIVLHDSVKLQHKLVQDDSVA